MVQVLILNTDDFIFPDFIDCHKKGMFSAGGLGWCGESGLDGSCSTVRTPVQCTVAPPAHH